MICVVDLHDGATCIESGQKQGETCVFSAESDNSVVTSITNTTKGEFQQSELEQKNKRSETENAATSLLLELQIDCWCLCIVKTNHNAEGSTPLNKNKGFTLTHPKCWHYPATSTRMSTGSPVADPEPGSGHPSIHVYIHTLPAVEGRLLLVMLRKKKKKKMQNEGIRRSWHNRLPSNIRQSLMKTQNEGLAARATGVCGDNSAW